MYPKTLSWYIKKHLSYTVHRTVFVIMYLCFSNHLKKLSIMNKKELVIKVSAKAQVSEEECLKVINAFEEVLSEEFSDSGSAGSAFDKAYRIMSFFKKQKEKKK